MIAGNRAAITVLAGSGSILTIAFAHYLFGCGLLLIVGPRLATLHAFAAFIVLAIIAASN